jgi:hypothetical protein
MASITKPTKPPKSTETDLSYMTEATLVAMQQRNLETVDAKAIQEMVGKLKVLSDENSAAEVLRAEQQKEYEKISATIENLSKQTEALATTFELPLEIKERIARIMKKQKELHGKEAERLALEKRTAAEEYIAPD